MKNSIKTFALAAALCAVPLCRAQSFNTIYTFPTVSVGYEPGGVPYIGSDGVLFGTTAFGGANTPCGASTLGCGTAFSLMPPAQSGDPWTQNLLYSFEGAPDGAEPATGVLPGPSGTLLGTTTVGGPASSHCHEGCGTLFQLTPPVSGGAWTQDIVYDFAKPDFQPSALLAGANGALFGAALLGGNQACDLGCGSVYEMAETAGTRSLTRIHGFAKNTGEYPNSPLAEGTGGVLYGTTELGGNTGRDCSSEGCGTVFSLTPPVPPATAWTFHDIYRFRGGSDGFYPATGLVAGADGTLYGTTYYGGRIGCAGNLGCGTVFSLTPPAGGSGVWSKTILYSFLGGTDGNYPNSQAGDLVIGTGGVIYGVTSEGGGTGCSGQGCGTLFQLIPPAVSGGSWTEVILHAFTGGADGRNPFSGPAIDPTGVLYGFAGGGTGTSCSGGGCGVVYQYVP
jgi:hypothetical protein